MGTLNREAILALVPKVEPVELAGGTAYVRGMTGTERDSFEASIIAGEGKDRHTDTANLRAKVVARCLCDEAGVRLFKDDEIDALGSIDGQSLDKLYAAAASLSGIRDGEVEAAAKN